MLEVRSLAPDDHADADDTGVAPRRGQERRRLGELEGAGHPVNLHPVDAEARRAERRPGAVHEALGDALVEPGGDDRETVGAPHRARAA